MEFVDSLLGQEVMASAALDGSECLPPPSYFLETNEPVLICGRRFKGDEEEERQKACQALKSFVWYTYRKGFPPIGDENGPTTDRGWGCMLRCGQMVVAEALTRLRLGRDWQWKPGCRDKKYLEILALFADEPSAPLSIHQFASTGSEDGGKAVGQWYGPNTVAHVVRRLLPRLPSSSARLRAHVVMDNLLVAEDVDADEASWTPLVLFVPLRLGLSEINPVYAPGLKACFSAPENIALGVIGGTPNHALYFVGCVGDELLYLDPHTTQQAVDVIIDAESDATYHCSSPKRMNILQIDPSLAACFLCGTRPEFEDFCSWSRKSFVDVDGQEIFEIVDTRPSFGAAGAACDAHEFDYETVKHLHDDGTESNDEFEIIG